MKKALLVLLASIVVVFIGCTSLIVIGLAIGTAKPTTSPTATLDVARNDQSLEDWAVSKTEGLAASFRKLGWKSPTYAEVVNGCAAWRRTGFQPHPTILNPRESNVVGILSNQLSPDRYETFCRFYDGKEPAQPNTPRPPASSQNDPASIAIASIQSYPEVVDAAITQRGNQISLVLIVRSATNQTRAEQLGDSFVRVVKTYSDDPPPGKDIGRGKYDYLVGVYYPNERQIAFGGKSRGARNIRW